MQTDNLHLNSYKYQLQKIFVYYASYADKNNYSLLKIQNFSRLLTDMQLITKPSIISHCDVIFYSKANHAGQLNFKSFLQILEPISSKLFQQHSPKERLGRLLSTHFEPLYDYIMKQTEYGQAIQKITPLLLKQSSYQFLARFSEGIITLYCHYFPKSSSSGEQEQFKLFSRMSRQLNFTPKVISRPISFIIFNFLYQRQAKIGFNTIFQMQSQRLKLPFQFDLVCFVDYIILLSQFNHNVQEKNHQAKIYKLLECLMVSTGYQQLSKKVKFQHFFLNQKDIEASIVNIEQEKTTNQYGQYPLAQKMQNKVTQAIESPYKKILGDYYDILKTKFIKLCTKKNVEHNFYAQNHILKSMILNICPKLSGSAIEEMLSSIGRVNFQNFIKLLKIISQKLSIDLQSIYDQVALYNIGQFKLSIVLNNMKLQPQEERKSKQLLKLVESYLKTLFTFYQYNNSSISASHYLQMMQDITFIPNFLNSSQAKDIYIAVVKHQDKMVYKEFEASLLKMIVVLHFQHQLQGLQRLLYLIQKICGSERGQRAMKMNGWKLKENPLSKLKLLYENQYLELRNKLKRGRQSQGIFIKSEQMVDRI